MTTGGLTNGYREETEEGYEKYGNILFLSLPHIKFWQKTKIEEIIDGFYWDLREEGREA